MQRYKIPYEFKFESKIVGGILSWRQALILAVPGLATISILSELHIPFLAVFLIEIFVIVLSAVFAFVKINGDDFTTFLKKYYDFKRRKKIILYRKED